MTKCEARRRHWGLLIAMFAVLIVVGLLAWRPGDRMASAASVAASPTVGAPGSRRETRPTLDPARFVGKAAITHQIARDIPDVLDQLYCYSQCDKHVGHKSLLSCYTDGHAAT